MDWETRIQEALKLDFPYEHRSNRSLSEERRRQATPAAVLLLIGFENGIPTLLYTKRTELVETHKGQTAFPGGQCEENELNHPEKAALRETVEEVGISSEKISVLGKLPELWTVTDFLVVPVVGILKPSPQEVSLHLSSNGIAEASWISIQTLEQNGVYQLEYLPVGEVRYPIHVYHAGGYRIWGATGSMTKNFLDRLKAVGV